jgi:hypothetical protein
MKKAKTPPIYSRKDKCPYAPVDFEGIWKEAFIEGYEKAVLAIKQGASVETLLDAIDTLQKQSGAIK